MPPQPKQPAVEANQSADALETENDQLRAQVRALEAKLASVTTPHVDITPERPSFGESAGEQAEREQREHAERVKT